MTDARSRWKRWRPHANLTWAIITAIVALAGSFVSLLFQIKPDLRPDPREKVSGEVRVVASEPGVTLQQWARLASPDDPGSELKRLTGDESPPAARTLVGGVLYVRVDLSGFKGRKVALRARVYNAHSQKQIDPDEIVDEVPKGREEEIDSPTRSSVRLLFLPDLEDLDIQKTFVRIELLSEGKRVAVSDSPTLLRGRLAAGQRAA